MSINAHVDRLEGSASRDGSPTTLVYVVGARPNFVKMAPVVREMRARAPDMRHIIVHTGQHYDAEMSEIFFRDLGLPRPDHFLEVGSGTHGAQTARALERLESVLAEIRPHAVVVPGDVNSTLAAALAAAKLEIPIAHIEAGLRSFDRSMPEELNRLLVDQLSRWCFIHSADAALNLSREGVGDERVHFVGNTMIDTLVTLRPRICESHVRLGLGLRERDYLLVTLHRPALVDRPMFAAVMDELMKLARQIPVVFPMHPRTRQRVPVHALEATGMGLIDPIGYVDFLALESAAAGVLTDSGGVQEETTFLGVPCFTLRNNTERPITVSLGTNMLLGLDPAAIAAIPDWLPHGQVTAKTPPKWDGMASSRVADALLPELSASRRPRAWDSVPLAAIR